MKKIIISLFLLFSVVLSACGNSASVHNTSDTKATPVSDSSYTLKKAEITWVTTPDSSAFTKIGYDECSETLLVVFRETGTTYEYMNFSTREWKAFLAADSKGKWYNAEIKPYYDYSAKY